MSQNKVQKKKEREERLRKQKHAESLRKNYPIISIINEDVVAPEFRIALENAVSKINFEDLKYINKQEDPRGYLKDINSATNIQVHTTPEAKRFADTIHLYVSTLILKNLGMNLIQAYMPQQGFRVYICKNKIFLICKTFDVAQESKGYYTNNRIITHHNKPCRLFFSKHMFQRLLERLSYISGFNCDDYDKYFKIAKTFCSFYEYCDIGLYKITSSFEQIFIDFYGAVERFEIEAGEKTQTKFNEWDPNEKILYTKYHSTINSKFRPTINNDVTVKGTMQFTAVKRLVCPFAKFSPNNDNKADGIVIKTSLLPGFDGTIEYNKTMSAFTNHPQKEFLFDIMRTPEKRYGKEFFQAQTIFHNSGVPQFFFYNKSDAVDFVTRSVGEDFNNIPELKNKNKS